MDNHIVLTTRRARIAKLCVVLHIFVMPWLMPTAFAAPKATPPEIVQIVYPKPESAIDQRHLYPLKILSAALSKAGMTMHAQPSRTQMPQARAIRQLASGSNEINILWTMTTEERERLLLPIRIPIDKGLLGWRVALVRADQYDLLQSAHNAHTLSRLTAGQGHDWPDTDILRAAGLSVQTSVDYESLFQMLAARRFDYFPRSIMEVWDEVEKHRQLGLIIEPSVVLHYPTALYFFVSKNNASLAERIQLGLERMVADGSLDRTFYQEYSIVIERAALSYRHVIELNNTILPAKTPLDRPELWFRRAVVRETR